MTADFSLGQPVEAGGRSTAAHSKPLSTRLARRRDAQHPPPGADCWGEAPHSCCCGAKGKIILQASAVQGEEQAFSQEGETRARAACQACMCVGLNLKAVTIKKSLNNDRIHTLPPLLLYCSVLLLQLHFARAPVYFMPKLCCCRAVSA